MMTWNEIQKHAKMIHKKYPEGTVVELIHMDDPTNEFNIPSGTKGTVSHVDDFGTIHVRWETGSMVGLVSEVDTFNIVQAVELPAHNEIGR